MKTMTYVQFFNTNDLEWDHETHSLQKVEPYFQEALASDGYFILDGRKRVDNLVQDAYKRMRILKQVKQFTGFKIRKGTFKHYRTLCSSMG